MSWQLFATIFGSVFVAELGDKSQLAAVLFAAREGVPRWAVFAGAALALVATSAIAVLAGEALSRVISPVWLERAAGVLFLVLGVWFLAGSSSG